MKRLTQEEWLNEGFKVLKETGAAGLTIENLTTRLNKTKGSFYHHFNNRDDYFEKLLTEWENRQTREIIKISKQESDFNRISRKLFLLSEKKYEPEVEVAIRSWALRDDLARSYQQRIDEQRTGFLNEMFLHITKDTKKTQIMSLLRYCFYIGSQQIIPPLDVKGYKDLLESLMGMLQKYAEEK